jgi:broad specificity phosphatase PhoE
VATAHPIAEALGLPVRIEEGLSEWLNPVWFSYRPELLDPEALAARFPMIDAGYESRVRRSFPENNERSDAWPAVARTARALLAEFQGNLLLVGHGASLSGIVHGLLGRLPVEIGYGSVTRLDEENGIWVLKSYEAVPEV